MEAQTYVGLSIAQTREAVAKELKISNNAKKHSFLKRKHIVLRHDTIGPTTKLVKKKGKK